MNIEIVDIQNESISKVAPLVACFRAALKSYKGIQACPNVEAGADEILEYLEAGFPIYAAIYLITKQRDFYGDRETN